MDRGDISELASEQSGFVCLSGRRARCTRVQGARVGPLPGGRQSVSQSGDFYYYYELESMILLKLGNEAHTKNTEKYKSLLQC